jgi:hypothetical protein
MMISNNEKPHWFFYLGWVVLNFIAVVIALYIALALISKITSEDDFLDVFFPINGLLTGILQYTLLRRYLPHMAWWIAVTFLGWLTPFATVYFLITFLGLRNDTFSMMFGLLLVGATVATPQWWMLRKRVRHASWWILAHGFGWSVTGLSSLVTSRLDNLFPVLLAFALMLAIATGFACWLLLDWLPKNELKSGAPSY